MRLEELVEAFRSRVKAEYRGPGYVLKVLTASGFNSCMLSYSSDGRKTNILMQQGEDYFVWDCSSDRMPRSIDDKMFALQEKIISILGMRRTIHPTMTKCSGDWHILEKDVQPTVRPVSPITIDNLWGEL